MDAAAGPPQATAWPEVALDGLAATMVKVAIASRRVDGGPGIGCESLRPSCALRVCRPRPQDSDATEREDRRVCSADAGAAG